MSPLLQTGRTRLLFPLHGAIVAHVAELASRALEAAALFPIPCTWLALSGVVSNRTYRPLLRLCGDLFAREAAFASEQNAQ